MEYKRIIVPANKGHTPGIWVIYQLNLKHMSWLDNEFQEELKMEARQQESELSAMMDPDNKDNSLEVPRWCMMTDEDLRDWNDL